MANIGGGGGGGRRPHRGASPAAAAAAAHRRLPEQVVLVPSAAGLLLLLLLLAAAAPAAEGRQEAPDVWAHGGAPGRELLALTTCRKQIPRCSARQCDTDAATKAKLCKKCLRGYTPSTGALNCVCPPGFYDSCTAAGKCSCVKCEVGFFCPGGQKAAANSDASASALGPRYSCIRGQEAPASSSAITTATIQAAGVTTAGPGGKSERDCFAMPGFYLISTQKTKLAAAPCLPGTYSAGLTRNPSCVPCPPGTTENPEARPTVRSNRDEVCQLPPGLYFYNSGGASGVASCLSGTFRSGWVGYATAAGGRCNRCATGTTTPAEKTGAVAAAECSVVLSAYEFTTEELLQAQAKAQRGEYADGRLCPFNKYCPGGTLGPTGSLGAISSVPCPFGAATRLEGSVSADECEVPPGYYVKLSEPGAATGELAKCPTDVGGTGFYRAGWASLVEPAIKSDGDGSSACTSCPEGVVSVYKEVDQRDGGADPEAKVAASADSCVLA